MKLTKLLIFDHTLGMLITDITTCKVAWMTSHATLVHMTMCHINVCKIAYCTSVIVFHPVC